MDFTKGMVVISRAGRDKGSLLAVVDISEEFIYTADGKERPLSNPKKKNPKHLAKTAMTVSLDNITDKGLRRTLRELSRSEQECE